jgi:protein-S-isoprenylcysteine O-methyltransferase Ste14
MNEPSFRVDIGRVQTRRKQTLAVALCAGLAVCLLGQARWLPGSGVHELIEWLGVLLIVMCIIGRTWCTLYIGGRKDTELVTLGPYSISRNPLYLFSSLGAAGIGAQFGTIVLAVAAALISIAIFYVVIRQEERVLSGIHGKPYDEYRQRVPLLVPRFSLWKDADVLEVRPPRIVMTFVDASLMLLAIPISELIERLQESAILPVFFRLP